MARLQPVRGMWYAFTASINHEAEHDNEACAGAAQNAHRWSRRARDARGFRILTGRPWDRSAHRHRTDLGEKRAAGRESSKLKPERDMRSGDSRDQTRGRAHAYTYVANHRYGRFFRGRPDADGARGAGPAHGHAAAESPTRAPPAPPAPHATLSR